jgi:hypothetical protein
MPRTPQRAGWWRFPAPSILVFTLLIGILPWVEVGCEGKPQDFQAWATDPLTGKKRGRPIGESGKVVLATQNGYQAIWGGSSPGPEIRELQREAEDMGKEMAKQMGPVQPPPNAPKAAKPAPKREDEPDAAPLLAAYFALVLAAVAAGYAMPPGLWRSAVFGGLVVLAVAAFGIQVALGLPVKKRADDPKNAANPIKFEGAGGLQMNAPNVGPKPYCRYTPWYYLSWPFLLLPLGVVGAEEAVTRLAGVVKKKPKKRRYDEEEEEDEEDRPRRRRPRDDDDEEEDAPRRKKRRYDDDEEDEEEERPRRQRF